MASRFQSVFSLILTFRLLPEPSNVFTRSRLRGSFQSMIDCSCCQKLKLAFIFEIERPSYRCFDFRIAANMKRKSREFRASPIKATFERTISSAPVIP